MTKARQTYLHKVTGKFAVECCCTKTAASEPGVCVAPVIASYGTVTGEIGSTISIVSALSSGTYPVAWSMTPVAGASIDSVTGLISFTITGASQSFTVTALNVSAESCGTDSETFTVTGTTPAVQYKFIFGNYIWGVGAPPTLTGSQLSDPNVAIEYISRSNPTTANGPRTFPARTGGSFIRQFIWIADSINTTPGIQLNISGGYWTTTPAPHTEWQILTVAGLPGKLYFVSDVNNGTYTVTISSATP